MDRGSNKLQDSLCDLNLVPVTEVPVKFQSIFQSFPYFNIMQSSVFEDAFYTDKPLVVCAPTGSGKTVVFELCIVRLLMLISEMDVSLSKFKIVYMAPVKSLCNERYLDWKMKFEPLGVLCIQLTGDSEINDYFELQKYTLILTTPEKWDSVTRLWKNNKSLVQMVKLLLIDEIHLLNEEERGATIEATLSRMKTIQFVLSCDTTERTSEPNFRFVAASATFPNIEDAANWLSTPKMQGICFRFSESLRPVILKKVIIGYPCSSTVSEFKFDLMLSYKLNQVIQTYSDKKPTLVFCSTRKSVVQTAVILSKCAKFVVNQSHKLQLLDAANRMHDSGLRECVLNGIGFHHGGLDASDRRLLENMFLSCQLLVLVSTSTLSMGVNFPAHLVVVKSTSQYVTGCYKEYSDTQILQMTGRAGRPQFDSSATAVIMTKSSLQHKYDRLINGTQQIESNLHKHMVEHLNAEIVLGAIRDISIAMEWLKSTYLYQRIFKNPEYYGMTADLSKDKIERKLLDICIKELNGLRKYELIFMDDDSFQLQPTKSGRLMAKYYIAYETMKQFASLTGNENLAEMIAGISCCKEFDDINLRVNEKRILNDLNKTKMSSVRFPLQGKIKNKQMKINCLIQATFGCLTITESSLNQDVARIFRSALRVSKCLVEYLSLNRKGFSALRNAVILSKCFKARLWENSKHVSRQLEKIGNALSTLLVNAGITTIEAILKTNPRDIELILKRNPPFGTQVVNSARKIPKCSLQVEQCPPFTSKTAAICVILTLENKSDVQQENDVYQNGCYLLIGDADNKTILYNKITNLLLLKNQHWTQKVDITRAEKGDEVNIYVINDTFVGTDTYESYFIIYQEEKQATAHETIKTQKIETKKEVIKNYVTTNSKQVLEKKIRECNHKCAKKDTCCHECCKTGVKVPVPKKSQMSKFMEQIQNKNSQPSKKVKIGIGTLWKHQNIKMFDDDKDANVSLNYNLTLQKTFEIKQDVLPEQTGTQQNVQDNISPYFNLLAEEACDKEKEKHQVDTSLESQEVELQNLCFDINFKDCSFEDKCVDDSNQKRKMG